jgi:thioredoxin 1
LLFYVGKIIRIEMPNELTREEVDKLAGKVLLDFGASWCPICQAFAPLLRELMKKYPEFRHIKIEDGKGKLLGRSFKVKLWPGLVVLKDGKVIHQLARPTIEQVEECLKD